MTWYYGKSLTNSSQFGFYKRYADCNDPVEVTDADYETLMSGCTCRQRIVPDADNNNYPKLVNTGYTENVAPSPEVNAVDLQLGNDKTLSVTVNKGNGSVTDSVSLTPLVDEPIDVQSVDLSLDANENLTVTINKTNGSVSDSVPIVQGKQEYENTLSGIISATADVISGEVFMYVTVPKAFVIEYIVNGVVYKSKGSVMTNATLHDNELILARAGSNGPYIYLITQNGRNVDISVVGADSFTVYV